HIGFYQEIFESSFSVFNIYVGFSSHSLQNYPKCRYYVFSRNKKQRGIVELIFLHRFAVDF
ncbi:MAG TPA: hypothetical protein PK976_06285, partial [Bacteroidales bacterium]|nr:hypothetical protein [Bacteroidales bacterium]